MLSAQNKINLRTIMGSDKSAAAVKRALLELDVVEENALPTPATSTARTYRVGSDLDDDECGICGLYEAEFDEDELNVILVALDEQDLDEDQIVQAFGETTAPQRRRTWQESKQLKNAKRLDRDFFDRRRADGRTKKVTRDDFKRRSRCSNCGERGHWREDCRKPFRSKSDRLKAEAQGSQNAKTGSFFFDLVESDPSGTSGTTWATSATFMLGIF
eukprot:458959-Pyramimonas_sp.AAC.1